MIEFNNQYLLFLEYLQSKLLNKLFILRYHCLIFYAIGKDLFVILDCLKLSFIPSLSNDSL